MSMSERELMEKFDNFINETNPTVIVMGMAYDPARVLKEFDPTAYEVEFSNWISEEYLGEEEEEECDGHESLAGEHMGETVYCDGECK